ncbi:MAG: preprotein translocase subunit YajC [Planctomycetota bacterium]
MLDHAQSLIGSWSLLGQEDGAPAEESFLVRLLRNPLFLPAGLMLIFYMIVIAPERRRKLEEAKRLAGITKNDRVVTAGGLHGVVVHAKPDSETVTIKLDESGNVRVKVSRWALTSTTEKTAEKEPAPSDKEKDGE